MTGFKGTKGKWEQEHRINNATLIAAAPEMLAALQNLENDNNTIPAHAWKLVQDAIKSAIKIKGENNER